MSFSTACNELVEAVLLFMELQHEHMSKASRQQLTQEVSVSLTAEKHENNSTGKKCNVRVAASGLGAYFLDGNSFLSKLCEQGQQLRCLLQANTGTESSGNPPSQLKLLCRRIGDLTNVVLYEVQGFSVENEHPLIKESVVPRPQHFPAAGLIIELPVNLPKEVIRSETNKLSAQLHLIHLVNPEVCLSLRVKDSMGAACSVQYDRDTYRCVARSPYKLITGLYHYMDVDSIPSRQSRLYLLKGGTHTIPNISLKGGGSLFLKLYCAAAVAPHLPLRNGRKIPANRLCNSLHLLVFGPSQLPLLSAGSQANFPLASLAEWENYGLSIGQPMAPRYEQIDSDSPVVPSIACEVANSRSRGGERPSSVAANHSLKLFIFLERAGSKRVGNDNEQWRQTMEVIHELQTSFNTLVVTHSRKFHQALHSVLNKLICNYGTHAKTSSVLDTAIPRIAEAVSSIVQHSTSEQFKATCKELAENEDDLERFVNQKLWRIAKEKLKISRTSDEASHNPDEPTSPEIIQAGSNAVKTKTVTSRRKPTSTQQMKGEGSKPDTEETQCSQDPGGESQMNSETRSPPTFNSQSLFHARISMRKKRSGNEPEDHDTQASSQLETPESPNTEDGENDYFDAFTTVEVMETRDSDSAPRQHTHTMDQPMVESQMEEECSVSLLGDNKTLQLLPPYPILHPPTPSPAPPYPILHPSPAPPPPPPIPSPHSYTSNTNTAATTGFDELESVDMEDQLSVVFSPPPRPTEAQPLERKINDSELSQPLQADGQLADDEATTQESDSFDQLECLSDIGPSVGDSSFTDCEVDLEDAFSTEDEVLADVGGVQTSTEVTVLDHDTVSDSEWNDLTMNSPTFLPPPDYREAPAISTLTMQDSNIQHSPENHNSSFDCLEHVEVNDDEETAGHMDHNDSTVLHNTTTPPQSCAQQEHVLHGDLNNRTNDDSWNLSDLEWDAGLEHPTSTSPPPDEKSYTKLKHELADQEQVMQTESNIVPDIMNESLTCDVAEEDFHWD